MGTTFKYYKRKFRNALQPLFVMLINKKKEMDLEAWSAYVKHTMTRVSENPTDFLGPDTPADPLTRNIVDDIFSEFLKLKGKS
jgi:hypothetical protein